MKFYRELSAESGKGFSYFFAIFSLVLMGLGFLTKMPWYLCFLFIAFTLLCVSSIVDNSRAALSDGVLTWFNHCKKRRAEVKDSNVLLLTEYLAPVRARGAKAYVIKTDKKKYVSRLYMVLLKTDKIDVLGKCVSNHMASAYFKKSGELTFSAMYTKELLAEIFRQGFAGSVYVFRPYYDNYRREIDSAVKEGGFDYSKVLVIGFSAKDPQRSKEQADDSGETVAEEPRDPSDPGENGV